MVRVKILLSRSLDVGCFDVDFGWYWWYYWCFVLWRNFGLDNFRLIYSKYVFGKFKIEIYIVIIYRLISFLYGVFFINVNIIRFNFEVCIFRMEFLMLVVLLMVIV